MDSIYNSKFIQSNFNQFLTWFLSPKSNYVSKEEPWNIPIFARSLSHSYNTLPAHNEELKHANIQVDFLSDKEYLNKDKDYLGAVVELKNHVNEVLLEYLHDFLIHGSIATMDYSKGWTDLDTFVIISSETILSPDKLIEFRKKIIDAHDYLLRIDPHQHHGFIFCTEKGLKQYFEHFVPLEVIRESKSLIRSGSLNLYYSRDARITSFAFKQKNNLLRLASQEGILKHHKYQNRYLYDNFKYTDTMYQLKYFLSLVMTLPAYYLDAKGLSCYKKNSFDVVKSKFQEEWEIIDKASEVRSRWASKEEFPYVGNQIPVWVMKILGDNYFDRAYKLSNAMSKCLSSEKFK